MAGQVTWVSWGDGKAYAAPYLSRELIREAMPWLRFDQLCEVPKDFGAGKGPDYFYRIMQDLPSSTSFADNVLDELLPIPLDTWSHLRTSVAVSEIGRGTSYTKKAQTLSSWDLDSESRTALRRHLQKVLEDGAATGFKATDIKYTPDGAASGDFVTDGTPGTDASHTLTAFHIREMVDYMEGTLKADPYDDDGNYVLVVGVDGRRALYDDLEIEKVQLYAEPARRLRGEIGRYYRTRILVTNNTTLGTVGTAACPEAVLTGKPGVKKPIVAAPILIGETRDHGRFLDVVWWGMLGYGLALDYSTEGMAAVIHVDST